MSDLHFKQAVKGLLDEMAAPKMPEGMKRKRDSDYAGVHHISIGGEHVATISGYKPSGGRYRTHSGATTEHGKVYQVHKNADDMLKSGPGHPDHQTTQTYHSYPNGYGKDAELTTHIVPKTYGSMEDAVHAVHAVHHNNKEFGAGHDPKVRWQKAVDSHAGLHAHGATGQHIKSAISSLKQAGLHDLAEKAQHAHDAHVAKSVSTGSKEDVNRWTHDAQEYAREEHVSGKGYVPVHPEHHALAKQALNVRHGRKPDGSY